MPYIEAARKKSLMWEGDLPKGPGELNFLLTMICYEYYLQGKNYAAINDVIGALECAKQEFYHRIAGPYEYRKMLENGDVYV